jgi:hypothetical protein
MRYPAEKTNPFYILEFDFQVIEEVTDRLYSLVVRVPGYKSRGPGSIPALPDLLR